jgi:hypothetical protein
MDAADTRTANPSHIDLQNLHYRALSLSETFAVLFMVAVFKPELTLNDKAGSRNVLHLEQFSSSHPASTTNTDKTLSSGAQMALSSVAIYSRLNVKNEHARLTSVS